MFSSDGQRVYVAGLGSGRVGIFDASALEAGTIDATTKHLVDVGGGPSGLALDEARNRLYVMNRFSHDISIVSNASNPSAAVETAVVPLGFDPEPPAVRDGRPFLYDARDTSGHGDSACASCHIFGDFDSLAWDLSDPFGAVLPNNNPFRVTPSLNVSGGGPGVGIACPTCTFHPMKGPMTTQTLRGMAGAGPMHWRGDRTGSTTGQDALDEQLAFKAFNPAFVSLLGRGAQLTTDEMQAFTDFILTVTLPPNPVRSLDDVATTAQSTGQNLFLTRNTDRGAITCTFCHRLPFGTDGLSTFEGETQEFKIPHLRNLYQKVGMFGVAGGATVGDQVRGFGFLHDGSVSTVFNFISSSVFQNLNTTDKQNIEQFLLAFDTGIKPSVGQQVSIDATTFNTTAFVNRINLLVAQADAGSCDLVVKGNVAGEARGALYVGGNSFQFDRHSEAPQSTTAVRNLAATAGQELTFTCVPAGSGERIGVDRDQDGVFDRRELDCATDPADPLSFPPPHRPVLGPTTTSPSSDDHLTGVATTSTTTSTTSTTHVTSTAIPTRRRARPRRHHQHHDRHGPDDASTTTSTACRAHWHHHHQHLAAARPARRCHLAGRSCNHVATMHDKAPSGRCRAKSPSRRARRRIGRPRVVVPAVGGAGDDAAQRDLSSTTRRAAGEDRRRYPRAAGGCSAEHGGEGYRFAGSDPGGPVSRVIVKADQLKVRAGKSSWTYTLNEPSQGRIAVQLQLGASPAWCTDAPAKASGNPPSTAANDRVDRFTAQPKTPAPAACPPIP